MISLKAKNREILGKKVKNLRNKETIPAVLYGPKTKNQNLQVDLKEFKKIFKEAGESSLISLELEGKKHSVLIHDIGLDPLTLEVKHIDFYQPQLDKEVQISVPLLFEGISLAVKDLGGTLIKEMQEIEVKAFPQNLPHDIKVDISSLKTFEDQIKIKDLVLPENVKVSKDLEEIVAFAAVPRKVEEELEKPIEEKVEDVENDKTKKEKEPEAEPEPIKKPEKK